MLQVHHDENRKEFWIQRKEGEEFITPAKIKEIISGINILFNNPIIDIFVSGGCIDVKPIEGAEGIDPPIFKEFKVVDIKPKNLIIEIPSIGKYQTIKLNEIYYFDGKPFESNIIEEVTFKYRQQ